MSTHDGIVKIVRPTANKKVRSEAFSGTRVFCHLAKTGGTTFRSIMGGVALCQNELSEMVFGNPEDTVPEIESWGGTKSNIRYLMGHIPLGSVKINSDPHIYMALVRDPVDRIISHIKMYELRTDETVENIDGLQNRNFSVPDGPQLTDNYQTRMLSGNMDVSIPCTRAWLDVAKENFEKNLCLVGLTKNFDEFVSNFLALSGGSSVMYGSRQISINEIPSPRLATLRQQVQERDTLDIELFNFVKDNYGAWNAKVLEDSEYSVTSGTTVCAVPYVGTHDSEITFMPDEPTQTIIPIPSTYEGTMIMKLQNFGYDVSRCL